MAAPPMLIQLFASRGTLGPGHKAQDDTCGGICTEDHSIGGVQHKFQ